MISPLLQQSDKFFWHGYVNFYEGLLPDDISGDIVEFGVFKGNSIRWLLERYPRARHIYGADILPYQSSWPVDGRLTYKQLNQDSEAQVSDFLQSIQAPELIIEDGSHIPSHQSRCLKHGMSALKSGGTYVLEDIQTSLPSHAMYANEFSPIRQMYRGIRSGVPISNLFKRVKGRKATSLSLLLAIEQVRRRGSDCLSHQELQSLSGGGHFSDDEIKKLDQQIASVHVYKRSTFPTACHACGSTVFDYHSYRCKCGVKVMEDADSMAVVIRKK